MSTPPILRGPAVAADFDVPAAHVGGHVGLEIDGLGKAIGQPKASRGRVLLLGHPPGKQHCGGADRRRNDRR